MITYNDYERAEDKLKWIRNAIVSYRNSSEYAQTLEQEQYMMGRNTAIMNMTKVIYDMAGFPQKDFTAPNSRIRNRLIHRMVSDRCAYSLGNGISFASNKKVVVAGGGKTVDQTKEMLGNDFDNAVFKWAYWSQANGAAYLYVHKGHDVDEWEYDLFKKSEFLALLDERTGKLRGGIRFWSLEWGKRPITAILYTEDGYQRYETPEKKWSISALQKVAPAGDGFMPYTETVNESEAYGEEVVGVEATSSLPIFALYPGENHVSVLDNLKPLIDSLDVIMSGFANDLQECAQVYWLISGAFGMTEKDKKQLLDRLILQHMAVVDGENSRITPYTQEIPYNARKECIATLRNQIYENFGGFDVHTVEAGATNDHVEAAYWPMDQEADNFEYQLIKAIQEILAMMGIEDIPIFQRNRISNQKEQTEMVMMASTYLDEQTILEKLPWITVDEIDGIMMRLDASSQSRFNEESEPEGDLNA